jgi:hypothetical protein
LSFVEAFIAFARSPEQVDTVADLLSGDVALPGLVVDTDLRWSLLRRLVVTGRAGTEEIEAERALDPTASGERSAAGCRAAIPTAAAKEAAWRDAVAGDLSTTMVRAVLDGFRDILDPALLRPYRDQYFELLATVVGDPPETGVAGGGTPAPATPGRGTPAVDPPAGGTPAPNGPDGGTPLVDAAGGRRSAVGPGGPGWPIERTRTFATAAFPSTGADLDTLTATDTYLDRAQPDWLRRLVVEARHEVARSLRAQAADSRLVDR